MQGAIDEHLLDYRLETSRPYRLTALLKVSTSCFDLFKIPHFTIIFSLISDISQVTASIYNLQKTAHLALCLQPIVENLTNCSVSQNGGKK